MKQVKKILIIADLYTNPIESGTAKSILAYRDMIKEIGLDPYFLFIGKKNKMAIEETMKSWNNNVLFLFQNSLEYYLSRLCYHLYPKLLNRWPKSYTFIFFLKYRLGKIIGKHKFDVVVANYPWLSFVLKYFYCKKILFTHDCFTNRNERTGLNMYSLTPNQESRILRTADCILSIQETESVHFRYLAPKVPCFSIYMPTSFHNTSIRNNKNMLYVAGANPPNITSMKKFIPEVFVPLKKVFGDLKLLIAGRVCDYLQEFVDIEGIELLGLVDNVDEFYELGDIAINPTDSGTGLKIKTIEGISYGKLVISSSHSIEGLYDNGNIPVICANTFDEYKKILYDLNTALIEEYKTKCYSYINDMNEYIKGNYKKALL